MSRSPQNSTHMKGDLDVILSYNCLDPIRKIVSMEWPIMYKMTGAF